MPQGYIAVGVFGAGTQEQVFRRNARFEAQSLAARKHCLLQFTVGEAGMGGRKCCVIGCALHGFKFGIERGGGQRGVYLKIDR